MTTRPTIAILGAGLGGLALAAALGARGWRATVYEQAGRIARLGAGIQMSPNPMRVLQGLGLADRIRRTAYRPEAWDNRDWDTGERRFLLPLGDAAEARYGLPYLLMHRGDLHATLLDAVPADSVRLGARLVDLERTACGVRLRFADGTAALADALVGADGVHSRVREILLGPGAPTWSGRVAYRAVFPAARIEGPPIGGYTKWWGPDRHIVVYFTTAARDEVYFVTSLPEPGWTSESWSDTAEPDAVRAGFAGFHDEVRRVLAACPRVHKWAILERDPLPRWSDGPVALLGDACHPMTPYMAQGAAMAMEDAVVLARCLTETGDEPAAAFVRYAALRRERTAAMQLTSHGNRWMNRATDPDWVYGYDAWAVPLAA